MPDCLPSPLPYFDRQLLRAVEKVVPSVDREEWRRSSQWMQQPAAWEQTADL